MKFSIELTEEEGSALLQLLDMAVKAQGLVAAGPAAALGKKVQDAYDAAKAPGDPDLNK
jgi:hypothetical protein